MHNVPLQIAVNSNWVAVERACDGMAVSGKGVSEMARTASIVVVVCSVFVLLGVHSGCTNHAGKPASAPTETPPQVATAWPVTTQVGNDHVTLYQPQLEHFAKADFRGRLAVAVRIDDSQVEHYGTAWINSATMCDRTDRVITLTDVNVAEVKFPGAAGTDEKMLVTAATAAISGQAMSLNWDDVLEMMKLAVAADPDDELSTAPPQIVFRKHPAVLVQYDGQPDLIRIQDSQLKRVVNTPFFVVVDPATKDSYLKVAGRWYSAKDPMGPFSDASSVSDDVRKLADKYGFQNPTTGEQAAVGLQDSIEIVTATEPTELIYTNGEPQMGAIAGTDLLYVTNTTSDVFEDSSTQQKYVLLSGRWYTSAKCTGPWTYVSSDKLPADFAQIPPGSPKGYVLANVAGTDAAREAVLDSQIPQTAMVDRNAVERPAVEYDGEPDFQPVVGTDAYYAPNTSFSVLRVGDMYYCCYNAVWYQSSSPYGPWDVCVSVPAAIYTIPPSCPIYPVRYCYVYNYTPDYVYCGYTPGYTSCFVFGPTVVFGTGFRYHCWFRERYFPRPCTFGFNACFDPFRCSWAFRCGFGVPQTFFGDRIVQERREHWGGGGWWGFGGFHDADDVVDRRLHIDSDRFSVFARRTDVRATAMVRPHVGGFAATAAARKFEGQVGAPIGQQTGRMGVTGFRRSETTSPAVGTAIPAAPRQDMRNNVLSDQQGNVHRMTLDGWESRQGTSWVARRPTPGVETPLGQPSVQPRLQPTRPGTETHERTNAQLEQEFRARVAAPERQNTWSRPSSSQYRGGESRGSSETRSGGSYRSSGGGSRGGGGYRGR